MSTLDKNYNFLRRTCKKTRVKKTILNFVYSSAPQYGQTSKRGSKRYRNRM